MPPLAGRRLVRPYFFEFVSHVKSRWAGQNIVELFSNEFRQRDRQYYVSIPQTDKSGSLSIFDLIRVGPFSGCTTTGVFEVEDG